MDLVVIGKLFAILLLVAGNAYFVGSEVAITAARRSRIKQLADMGDSRAKVIKLLHDEPTRFYAVTQIGITMVSMGLGYVGMDTIKDLVNPAVMAMFAMFGDSESLAGIAKGFSLFIAFAVISFLHVVGGELAPKVLAYHKSIPVALSIGKSINFLYVSMIPIIWVMNQASNLLLILFGQGDIVGKGDGHGDSGAMSKDEISLVVSASVSAKSIDMDQGRMLMGCFELDDMTAEQAMVPKPDVHGLPSDATYAEALSYFVSTNHRRYPVFDAKKQDKVVGVMPIKKLVHIIEQSKDNLAELMTKHISSGMRDDPFIIPNGTPLSQVLKDFKVNRRQFGVVVDEYGTMIGVLTPENIVAHLVGEYRDEFSPVSKNITKLQGSQWEINGGVRVADLEMLLEFPFPTSVSYVTLSGLMFHKIGRVPEVGDVVQLDNGRLQILEISEMRITKVLFQILAVDEKGKWHLADQDSAPEA